MVVHPPGPETVLVTEKAVKTSYDVGEVLASVSMTKAVTNWRKAYRVAPFTVITVLNGLKDVAMPAVKGPPEAKVALPLFCTMEVVVIEPNVGETRRQAMSRRLTHENNEAMRRIEGAKDQTLVD